MIFRLTFWTLLAALSLDLMAADRFILLNGQRVHPTRVLAKYAKRKGLAAQALHGQAMGYSVLTNRFGVENLALIDTERMAGNAADSAPDRMRARLKRLRDSGEFEYVEPDYIVHVNLVPNDTAFADGTLWGLNNRGQGGGKTGADIQASAAWDISTGSTNVIVAVIDTGVRYTHNELRSQMWRNPGEIPNNGIDDDGDGFVDNVFGINAVTGTGDPFDDNGHGTHVAGTIGAAANDGNPHVGVAWNVRIMACKFLDFDGFGATSDAITCIDFAVRHKAQVLNNSWGGGPYTQALFDAIANARQQGVLFVASAGNEANNNDVIPDYPASFQLDNIISVAALDRFDQLADFSNYGATNVHIGAPGVEIFSSWNDSDSGYNTIDGTSMAAPHVTGVAALIWGRSPGRSYAEVRDHILSGATRIPSLSGKVSTGARLNAFRSLEGASDNVLEVSIVPVPGSALPIGTVRPFFVSVTDDLDVLNANVSAVTLGNPIPILFRNDGVAPDQRAGDGIYSANIAIPNDPGSFNLSFTVTAPGKQDFQTNVTYFSVALPTNDNFVGARKIPAAGGSLDDDNRFATMQAGEPRHAGVTTAAASLWYAWSPASSGTAIIDTAGTSFDAVVGVYTGTSVQTLTEVASADDVSGKKAPYLFVNVVQAQTYYIAVAGATTNQTGFIHLRVQPNGGPDLTRPVVNITSPVSGITIEGGPLRIVVQGTAMDPLPNASGVREVQVKVNDKVPIRASGTTNWISTNLLEFGENIITVVAFDNAENISLARKIQVTYKDVPIISDFLATAPFLPGTSGSLTVSNTAATKEFNEPFHAGNEGGHSLWWDYTPATDGLLLVSTTGSSFDTLLAVYTGTKVSALTPVASNDDDPNGGSSVLVSVKGGTTYHIAVDGFGGATGTVKLSYLFNSSSLFRVNASVRGGGGVVSPSNEDFPSGSTVSVVATPDDEFQFDHFELENGQIIRTNPYTFSLDRNRNIVAVFVARVYTDDFETGSFNRLPWRSQGWVVQSAQRAQGSFAASSGSTPNLQQHSLELTVFTEQGQGSFFYKVSSEKTFDFYEFSVNGVVLKHESAEVDWTEQPFQVGRGLTTLRWTYTKDPALSAGLDAAFIDKLQLPIGRPDVRLSDGSQLTAQFTPGTSLILESSSDLRNWQFVETRTTSASGQATFSRFVVPGTNRLFYRVRLQ